MKPRARSIVLLILALFLAVPAQAASLLVRCGLELSQLISSVLNP